jgi:LytS/YehU family sensor histidine kinase
LSDDNIKSEILVYSRLEELYEQQHNTTKLVNVSRILLELTDKNYSLSMANRLKDIEASNIVKQKDANIKELNLKNKIAGQQLQLRNILILLLLLVSAGAVLLIYQYYHSRKIKEENSRIVVEQKLFAAQITPHFMFNALSGVQAEILSNNPRQASNYLASFGQFLQSVLAGTTQEYISIGQEYKNLQHYLILQKIRFDNFEYEMIGYEGIEEDEDQIAPMLIQPLVENAIEHGVKQMDYKGMIVLRFAKDDQSFTCEVLDNGGGLSTKGKNGKLSVSTQLIQKRLQYLSKTSQTKAYLLIQDRADAHGVLSRIVMPVIKNN